MYRLVTVEKTFDMAHRLLDHKGKCFGLHGHTYKIKVSLVTQTLNSNNMIIDFNELKAGLKPIISIFDHAMALRSDDPLLDLVLQDEAQASTTRTNEILWYHSRFGKIVVLEGETTVEYLAEVIGKALQPIFSVKIKKIELWETPTCYTTLLY